MQLLFVLVPFLATATADGKSHVIVNHAREPAYKPVINHDPIYETFGERFTRDIVEEKKTTAYTPPINSTSIKPTLEPRVGKSPAQAPPQAQPSPQDMAPSHTPAHYGLTTIHKFVCFAAFRLEGTIKGMLAK